MTDVFDVLNALSSPVKIGWAVWMVWGMAQIIWYSFARKQQPSPAVLNAVRRASALATVQSIAKAPARTKPSSGVDPVVTAPTGNMPAAPHVNDETPKPRRRRRPRVDSAHAPAVSTLVSDPPPAA